VAVTFSAANNPRQLERLNNPDHTEYWESGGHPDFVRVKKPSGVCWTALTMRTYSYDSYVLVVARIS
jgi:hypothetical protein